MSKNFFDFLQQFMMNNLKDKKFNACGYFHTILQQSDKLSDLTLDYDKYACEINYEDSKAEDGYDYYNPGRLTIRFFKKDEEGEYEYQDELPHNYTIDFLIDERNWGYCQCTEKDEGYNYTHKCCGNGCDWTAPSVSVVKHIDISFGNFNGVERDLWKLEVDWSGNKEDMEEQKLLAQIKHYEDQIAYWTNQRDTYLSKKTS